jgi:hypothetical protein
MRYAYKKYNKEKRPFLNGIPLEDDTNLLPRRILPRSAAFSNKLSDNAQNMVQAQVDVEVVLPGSASGQQNKTFLHKWLTRETRYVRVA